MTLLVLIGSMIYMWVLNEMSLFQERLSGHRNSSLISSRREQRLVVLYIMNIDHCNSHSSFKDKVNMSNLCQEITLPTDPINHIDDEFGEIALCILSAINVGKVKTDEELENLCDLSVRGLEELIDLSGVSCEGSRTRHKGT